MATSLTINSAAVSAGYSMSNPDGLGGQTTNSNTLSWNLTSALTNGTGAGKAQKLYVAKRTIAASANDDLDLAGSLTDFFGNTISFAKVKGVIVIHLTETTASAIQIGGGSNTFSTWLGATGDIVKVPNGYSFALLGSDANGFAVTATTGDILRITNNDGANTATYQILIYGE